MQVWALILRRGARRESRAPEHRAAEGGSPKPRLSSVGLNRKGQALSA